MGRERRGREGGGEDRERKWKGRRRDGTTPIKKLKLVLDQPKMVKEATSGQFTCEYEPRKSNIILFYFEH